MPTVTLGDLLRQNIGVLACCTRCGRNASIATAPLVDRFGEDFPVPGLNGKLRCSRCGSRETEGRPDYRVGNMGLGE